MASVAKIDNSRPILNGRSSVAVNWQEFIHSDRDGQVEKELSDIDKYDDRFNNYNYYGGSGGDVNGITLQKNLAGQVIGAQMINVSDGEPFTGTVLVYITGDGGSQTLGSVNSGEATDEGNGFYSYIPSQAETNFDHIAFTFIGTGAVPVTIQVYTV